MIFQAGKKDAVKSAVDNALKVSGDDTLPFDGPVFGNDGILIDKREPDEPGVITDLPVLLPEIVPAVGFADIHLGNQQTFGAVLFILQGSDFFRRISLISFEQRLDDYNIIIGVANSVDELVFVLIFAFVGQNEHIFGIVDGHNVFWPFH